VLVCIGGLLDGDLMVRAQTWFNGKTPFTGGGMIADVPAQHRLSTANPTFRGNLMVTEGTMASTAILPQSSGVLLQELPFAVELKKFIVEYYDTGMPRLFASDIVVHDFETGEKKEARVEVNHPVIHRGVAIYQSSFDDGGSKVKLQAMPFNTAVKPFEVQGTIGGSVPLSNGDDKLNLEFTALRVINVENFANGSNPQGTDVRAVDLRHAVESRLGAANKTVTEKHLRNVGPSITYKLRDPAGQAIVYHNYMLPVDIDGQRVHLLGMRETPQDPFRYLRVPVDDQDSMRGFLLVREALMQPFMRELAVQRYAEGAVEDKRPDLVEALKVSSARALGLFAGAEKVEITGSSQPLGGLPAVSAFLETNVPAAEREKASEVLVRILNGTLFELMQLSRERAGLAPLPRDEAAQRFMTQTVLALSDSFFYPAPMVFQLTDFEHIQASVFQVARAPGQTIVYIGCALLIVGIFAMLYVRDRRIWVWIAPRDGGADATMALSSNRKTMDADKEFDGLKAHLLSPTAQVNA
jgi:cytochrome c biogenesis protein